MNSPVRKKRYPFGTVGYFTHRGNDYPCVIVGLRENGAYDLYHQGGLIFPERNLPLYAEESEFRPDPRAARWLTRAEEKQLDVRQY
jgi:hypothetical protein